MYSEETTEYEYIPTDIHRQTFIRIKELSDDDLSQIVKLNWEPITLEKISSLVGLVGNPVTKPDAQALISMTDDQKRQMSTFFQKDETLLRQLAKLIEKQN